MYALQMSTLSYKPYHFCPRSIASCMLHKVVIVHPLIQSCSHGISHTGAHRPSAERMPCNGLGALFRMRGKQKKHRQFCLILLAAATLMAIYLRVSRPARPVAHMLFLRHWFPVFKGGQTLDAKQQ